MEISDLYVADNAGRSKGEPSGVLCITKADGKEAYVFGSDKNGFLTTSPYTVIRRLWVKLPKDATNTPR